MGFDLTAGFAGGRHMQRAALQDDCMACNQVTARYGLSLTEEQMGGLMERRAAVLAATGRVEFGRGVLRELVQGFADSPYLTQENYESALADVQDAFYRRKEDSEAHDAGPLADDDLIEAMRYAFDHEVAGSTEVLADVGIDQLRTHVNSRRAGDYDTQTQDAYFEEESAHDGFKDYVHDEFNRVLDDERGERPSNEFAAGYYDGYNELYRIGFDSNSRIGGSALGR